MFASTADHMAALDEILDQLRRHRQDVDQQLGERSNAGSRADEIIRKLEELRRRSQATDAAARTASSKPR
jgi:hypothetical protein